jgi:hypothetical protein
MEKQAAQFLASERGIGEFEGDSGGTFKRAVLGMIGLCMDA